MKKGVIFIVIGFIFGCVREKIKEVDYCSLHPDAPECQIPEDPCSLYPDLYFYCITLPPEEFCKRYPDLDMCQELTPEYVCAKHPDWSICKPLPPNYPPVITLTASSTCGQYEDVITIDASKSKDPDEDSITFSWQVLSGDGNFVSPLTSIVQFQFSEEEGDVVIKLLADDGRGGKSEEIINLFSLGKGIFVSPDGNDGNSGRFNEPVSSISKAMERAYLEGINEIKMLEGEYTGGIEITSGGIAFMGGYYRDGDCWRRDFENYWTVITSPISSDPSYVFMMTSIVRVPVIFDGLYLIGATSGVAPSLHVYGIYIDGGYGAEIRDSYIYGGEGPRVRGIYVTGATEFSLIRTRVYGGKSSTIGAMYPVPRRGGIVVTNTYSAGITSSIIDAGQSFGSASTSYIVGLYMTSIADCSVFNSSIYGGTGYNSTSGGYDFKTVGFATNSGCLVYHNHFDGGHPIEDVTSGSISTGLSYAIYLLSGASTDIKIINNIIDPGGADAESLTRCGRYGVRDDAGIAPDYIFKNNDIYSILPCMPSQPPVLYFDSGGAPYYTDISPLNSIDGDGGNFDGNISLDPLFDADGIHLSIHSPLIDRGYPGSIIEVLPPFDIDGDVRPLGNAPDIGPDEVR